MRLVVADTGPLNYLVLTGYIELLPELLARVLAHGGGLRLRDLLPRLRCKQCGNCPKAIDLIEQARGPGWTGAPDGWRVPLSAQDRNVTRRAK
jgi:hypothetical protein